MLTEKIKNPIILFAFASFYFFLLGFETIFTNVSFSVSLVVAVFFFIVLIVQVLLLKLIFSHFQEVLTRSLIIGFLLSTNAIAFYVSFFEKFLSMAKVINVLVLLLIAILFTFLFNIARRNQKINLFFFLVISFNSILVGSSFIFLQDQGPSQANKPLEIYNKIKYKDKPNVHLISFDSMIPKSLAKKHMGLDNLSYSDYLAVESSVVFKNMFVSNAPTRDSLNSILRLADPNFSSTNFFSGQEESPVFHIFKMNGYKIATGNSTFDFFDPKGEYVDKYSTLSSPRLISDSILCRHSGNKQRIVQLYGFCNYAPIIFEASDKTDKSDKKWYEIVFDLIGEKGNSAEPWITFHYVYNPIGHTPQSHNSNSEESKNQYTQFFWDKNLELSRVFPKLVKTIKDNDPDSIVFIFGDHGPWLSRTSSFEKSPEFFVTDRYGVYGSLLKTDNLCSSEKSNYYNKTYSTPERVLAGIIRCLSIDPKHVDDIVNFEEKYPFGEYLYE